MTHGRRASDSRPLEHGAARALRPEPLSRRRARGPAARRGRWDVRAVSGPRPLGDAAGPGGARRACARPHVRAGRGLAVGGGDGRRERARVRAPGAARARVRVRARAQRAGGRAGARRARRGRMAACVGRGRERARRGARVVEERPRARRQAEEAAADRVRPARARARRSLAGHAAVPGRGVRGGGSGAVAAGLVGSRRCRRRALRERLRRRCQRRGRALSGQLEVAPDRARRARVYWQVCREQSTTATSDTESAVSAEVRHDLVREQL